MAIFGILLGAIFGSISSSRVSWKVASEQIDRQQDARKAIDRIAWELRSTNPSWEVDTTSYSVVINSLGDQLDFYVPVFDANNEITALRAVRYYIGGLNNAQLLRKESSGAVVVANNIDNIAAQKPFFAFNNTDNTIVDIKIPVIKNNVTFILASQANLRNRQIDLSEDITIEEILEE